MTRYNAKAYASEPSEHYAGTAVNPRPHCVACEACRHAGVCNHCGEAIEPALRCTQGRCLKCHDDRCVPSNAHGWKGSA